MSATCLFSKLRHLDSISCSFAMSIHSLRSLPSGKTKMNQQFASAVMVCHSSPAFMTTMARMSMQHQLKLPAITSPKPIKCLSAGLSNRAFRTLESAPYRSFHAMSDREVRQYADESGSCPTAGHLKGLLCNVLFHFVLGGVALSKMAPGSLDSEHTRRRV
jgi:hypothetical protein